jgi:hypothetical protein
MKKLRLYNIIIGWIVFAISAVVYLSTLEPTASLWDCGEFIATAFKLQVGHPPGAPLFMITARLFTFLAHGDLTKVALMVNTMSGLASAFTILFLFWSISHLAIKLVNPENEIKTWQYIAIFGSAAVGALAFTFTDSFWFSAVEGEVYASSSFYTAIVFWAILKWENVADEKFANRWIILIAYLMGLSIGVHLLILLAIPAIILVYYFKKFEVTRKGIIFASLISFAVLGGVMYVIIPGVIWVASLFELLFVNSFGLPFNSGIYFYAVLLITGLIYGIHYTYQKRKVISNTIFLAITVILIGYSSFAMIVIRSHADPPMDENDPETVFSLMYYLNREQYGDRPLLVGQYFNANVEGSVEKKATYTKRNGRYEVTNHKVEYKYNKDYTTIFPRMYSNDATHIDAYLDWGNINESDVFLPLTDENGQIRTDSKGHPVYDRNKPKEKPTFGQNLRFFFSYQLDYMYFRYFMWNFSGRQNDNQGYGGPLNGNWITGIPPIDNLLIGEKVDMPSEMKHNPSRNKYYMLPFILGIIGILYQYQKAKKDFWVVMVLFFMTGIAIVLYLNQTPFQPRERDYAYAGSFYAFAIWIGLGVLGIIEFIGTRAKNNASASLITLFCLIIVPGIMAKENWKDHDRSGRYLVRDIASNYLNSCEPNAILFTNGDNDTFPLWYAQDVEGIRTDVRVVNLMLLNMDWYIEQMQRKAYNSDALPISLTEDKYINGTRDAIYIQERFQKASAKEIIEFVGSDDPATRVQSYDGKLYDYVPVRNYYVPVDTLKVLKNGTVKSKDASLVVKQLEGKLSGNYLTKSDMIVLDIIANNNWDRPIYFVSTGHSGTVGLENYLQLDGFAYRLVPIKTVTSSFDKGRVDTDVLYDKLMNTYQYGRMNQPDVYLDNFHLRTLLVVRMKYRFSRLAMELAEKGDLVKAEQVLDRITELTPSKNVPYDMFNPGIAEAYYKINKFDKGNKMFSSLIDIADRHLKYYASLNPKYVKSMEEEITYQMRILGNTMQVARQYNQTEMAKLAEDLFTKYNQKFSIFR